MCASGQSCVSDEANAWPPYCVTAYACANNSGCCFTPDLCGGTGHCVQGSQPQTIVCVSGSGGSSSGGSFACGDDLSGQPMSCTSGEYCSYSCFGGVYSCPALPAGCDQDPSCDCLQDAGTYSSFGGSCTDDGGGPFVNVGGGC